MVIHQIKVLQSLASSLAEGGRGVSGTPFPIQPAKPLKLYEFEGSPFCRRVREAITLLNLDVEIYPCPKGGQKYRQIVKEKGGKLQFPFLSLRTLFIIFLNIMGKLEKRQRNIAIIQKSLCLSLQEHF